MEKSHASTSSTPETESTYEHARRLGEEAVADFIAFGKMPKKGVEAICGIVEGWKKRSAASHVVAKMFGAREAELPVETVDNPLLDLLAGGVERLRAGGDETHEFLCAQRTAVQRRIEDTVRVATEVYELSLVTPAVEHVRRFFSPEEQ
jgi:hypothetical protein